MKGTIDLVIKIDGAKVETIFSMRDGVEDMDIDVVDKVSKAATNFARTLKKRISENCPPRKQSKIRSTAYDLQKGRKTPYFGLLDKYGSRRD